jgi:hypothetical protein
MMEILRFAQDDNAQWVIPRNLLSRRTRRNICEPDDEGAVSDAANELPAVACASEPDSGAGFV